MVTLYTLTWSQMVTTSHKWSPGEDERPGKVPGHLVVALEEVAHRIQERAGRAHVSDWPPGATPVIGKV